MQLSDRLIIRLTPITAVELQQLSEQLHLSQAAICRMGINYLCSLAMAIKKGDANGVKYANIYAYTAITDDLRFYHDDIENDI